MQTRTVGGYDLMEFIGGGGMGQVFRARHRRLGRDAAIKLVRPGGALASEDVMRAQFEREARVTAALGSPHTVRVFDFGTTDAGELFYAMELLQGCDLDALVRRFGPLPEDRALHLLTQACDSIAEAHACGIVHGDIKPANLYTCRIGLEYDVAKVIDFGLVRAERQTLIDRWATPQTVTLGTPAYLAPEIVLGGESLDRRTDVYALGCVAYFLLTGQPVFEAATPAQMLWQHAYAQPVAPSLRAECVISRDVDDLILSCLQKDARLRPRDADDLRRRLASVRRGAWDQVAARRWWAAHLPEFAASIESHGSSPCRSLDVAADEAA